MESYVESPGARRPTTMGKPRPSTQSAPVMTKQSTRGSLATGRRSSQGSETAEWGIRMGEWIMAMKLKAQNKLSGNQKDLRDQEVDALAAIIRMYRGIAEEEEKDQDRAFPDRGAFEIFMSVVVVLNMIVIGLELEVEGKKTDDREVLWIILEVLFCFIFCLEIVLKFRAHGIRWLVWDVSCLLHFTIAMCILLDCALFHPLGIYSYLRLASLFRLFDLLTLSSTFSRLHIMEELRLVLDGLKTSFGTIFWVFILLFFFLYMCAIFTTEQIGHNDDYIKYRKMSGGWDHEEYFGTIGRSMFTLLQIITLDSWSSKIARHVINMQWELSFFFLIFSVLGTYGVLNILISVIIENMLQAAAKNDHKAKLRLEATRKLELENIKEVFVLSDTDGSGEVDLREFLDAAQNPEVQWRMKQLGLPLTQAAKLFAVIDGDGSRTLTIEEFINGCKKLKGIAQSKDLLVIQAQADIMSSKMEGLARSLEDSERMMHLLDTITKRTDRRFPIAVESSRRKAKENAGSMKPMVPVAKKGKQEETLSVSNCPKLPSFPNLLA
jgi:voltage-gated sodium channel